jgi:hypothetical protein
MYVATFAHLFGGAAWVAFGLSEFVHVSPLIKGGLAITAGLTLIFMGWLEEWGW